MLCIYQTAAFLLLLLFFFLSPLLPAQAQHVTYPVAINEVMASNSTTITDEDGDAEDWIELYNYGNEPVILNGFGLSDDYDRPYRWVLPNDTLQPGQFLLVWASGKDRRNPENELHTNFSISSAGEEILLTSYSGERLDELEPVELPTDISIGRVPDGTGEWFFFNDPTPNASNTGEAAEKVLEPPAFSHIGGFYQNKFELDLSHPDPHITIYYTLDGSTPTSDSHIWTDPIVISDRSDEPNTISEIRTTFVSGRSGGWKGPKGSVPKANVIRAVAMRDGSLPSQIETHTYFLPSENHDPHTLPVFSLSTDPENLFDHDYGIYVPGAEGDPDHPGAGNFNNRGIEWERTGSLEFFETNGDRVLATDMGYRIHGNWTRRFAQKSLRLYARNAYGDNLFHYRFFEELPFDQYNRLILRISGNDWGYSLFRDALAQQLVSHLNFDTQAYRPSVLYINGEYWGIHNIRERYDRHYLNRVYGLEEGEIDLLDGRYYASEGDRVHWVETLDYAENYDLSIGEHYEHMQTRIDIDNYLNYFITNIFFANNDWPHNNYDYFRKRVPYDADAPPGHDGRWRWLLVDLDRSFNLSTQDHFDMIDWVTSEVSGRTNTEWPNLLFRNLLKNEHFKHLFINKIAGHLNTTFHPDRLKKGIEEMIDRIEPEMETHMYRWQKPESYDDWFNHSAGIQAMFRFVDNRAEHLRTHVRDHFSIDSDVDVTVEIDQRGTGAVSINSFLIEPGQPGVSSHPWPWTGSYFEGIPLVIEAQPYSGFRFSHWDVNGDTLSDQTVTVTPTTNLSITAFFERDPAIDIIPEPFTMSESDFEFSYWPSTATAGEFPEHMAFVYMDEEFPGPDASIAGNTFGKYNENSGTRINGLHDFGFSFINDPIGDANRGYPSNRLGGVLLAMNTRDQSHINVSFSAGTVHPGDVDYHLSLQYRIFPNEAFKDVVDENGIPVIYKSHPSANHRKHLGPFHLPEETLDQFRVELLWRFYSPENKEPSKTGKSPKINISNIRLFADPAEEKNGEEYTAQLLQNYPNPFTGQTMIPFELSEATYATLTLYSITGQRITTIEEKFFDRGNHTVSFDATNLASGLYLYRLQTPLFNETRKMILIK